MKQLKQALTKSAAYRPYMLTIVACALTTAIAQELATTVDLANIVMLFLLAVFLISVRLGRGPGILAAFLSVALFDFFFVPPHFTFAVSNVQYLLTFVVMLVVALITGQLAASLHTQAEQARAREQRTLALSEMARVLSGALNIKQAAITTKYFLHDVLKLEGLLLLPQADGDLASVTEANVWYERHMAYAAYENSNEKVLSEPDGIYYFPLKGSTRMRGVLVVALPQSMSSLPHESREMLVAVASLVAITIERLHYVEVAQDSQMQMLTERLRSSILSALSHDLRTPLTVLVGMADTLAISKPPLSPQQQETAKTIHDQSMRLSSMVTNLLDMARLHAGKLRMHKEWQPLEEVIGASIQILGHALEKHPVTVNSPADLPMLEFDAVLIERVFCNLLENAMKYSSESSAIEISAEVQGEFVCISVCDSGCGIAPEKLEAIFGMFVRGHSGEEANTIGGTGIGLAVCRSVVEAHGGTIKAENRAHGGACFSFTLPKGTPPIFDEALLEGKAV